MFDECDREVSRCVFDPRTLEVGPNKMLMVCPVCGNTVLPGLEHPDRDRRIKLSESRWWRPKSEKEIEVGSG